MDQGQRPIASPVIDWMMVALCFWLLGGLYLDGWAHEHIPNLETFFTPWHAVLYASMGAVSVFLLAASVKLRSLPDGYGLSLVGVLIFAVGGLSDMAWHALFGIEKGIDALLSPTHLILAIGGSLIVTGPLRSAWRRLDVETNPGWAAQLPTVLSLTFLLSVFTFFTQFAHPLVVPVATPDQLGVPLGSEIYLMAADGSGQTRLTIDPTKESAHPSWSPDGRKVAFASNRDGNFQIYVMNADGQGLQQLSNNQTSDSNPSWSPEGSKIAFLSKREGIYHLYIMNVDGTAPTRLTTREANEWPPAWRPDGKSIAFTAIREGKRALYVVNVDGSEEARLTTEEADHGQPSWAPNGSKIAYASNREGNVAIYITDAAGSGVNRLTNTRVDFQPAWSPDGNRIAFVSRRDGNQEIYVMNQDGSNQTNLTRSPTTEDVWPSWSPDGRYIIYVSQARQQGMAGRLSTALGVGSILFQTIVLMGTIFFALRRWSLPFGSLTLLLTINGMLMSVLEDRYLLVPAMVVAGLAADLFLRRLKQGPERKRALRLFGFVVPSVLYGGYFLTVALTAGIGWPVHLWTGSIVLAGLTGYLVSFLVVPPSPISESSLK